MYYITDTHAFLWYIADSPKLSKRARELFERADRGEITIVIPAIILLECIDIFDKKKMPLEFEDIATKDKTIKISTQKPCGREAHAVLFYLGLRGRKTQGEGLTKK